MHPHMERYYQIVMTKTCSMRPIWSEQIDHDDHYCADMITLRKGTFKNMTVLANDYTAQDQVAHKLDSSKN